MHIEFRVKVDTIDCIRFVIKKAASKMIIDPNSRVFIAKYSVCSIWEAAGIDEGHISKEIASTKLDMILVPLQIAMVLGCEMECNRTGLSVSDPIYCLIIPIFDIKCFIIFYYKFFNLSDLFYISVHEIVIIFY